MTSTIDFYESDFSATLYPLKTNQILLKHHSQEMSEYIYQKVINPAYPTDSFLSQQKVFSTKPKGLDIFLGTVAGYLSTFPIMNINKA